MHALAASLPLQLKSVDQQQFSIKGMTFGSYPGLIGHYDWASLPLFMMNAMTAPIGFEKFLDLDSGGGIWFARTYSTASGAVSVVRNCK